MPRHAAPHSTASICRMVGVRKRLVFAGRFLPLFSAMTPPARYRVAPEDGGVTEVSLKSCSNAGINKLISRISRTVKVASHNVLLVI